VPVRNARIDDENQEASLDLGLLFRIVAKLGSDNEPEQLAGLRAGNRMMARHGVRWEDLVSGYAESRSADAQNAAEQRDIAVEAAAVLQERVNELEGRLAAYERDGGGPAVEAWHDVGALDPQEWARRVLAEHAAKRIYLNRFEFEFLPSVAAWGGALPEPLQSVFDKIKASVTRRSGKPVP
jgi:hypothetical protein